MEDPCFDAVVNSDGQLVLESLIAPDDVSVFDSKMYEVPTNSAEIESSGLRDCGAL